MAVARTPNKSVDSAIGQAFNVLDHVMGSISVEDGQFSNKLYVVGLPVTLVNLRRQ